MSLLEKIKKGLSKFWNETLGPDYSTAELAELNINSTDPTEAALAKSSAKIDEEVENYGNGGKTSSRAQRKQMLKDVEVKEEELKPKAKVSETKGKEPKAKESKAEGRGRDD